MVPYENLTLELQIKDDRAWEQIEILTPIFLKKRREYHGVKSV